MASNPILLKRSLSPGQIPTTESLFPGEIALNVPDGKAFLRKSGSDSDTIESFLTTNTSNSGSVQLTGSFSILGGITGSVFGSSSYSTTASHAISAPLYLPLAGGTIAGDLVVNNNLTVYGTASFIFVTASQLDISASFISVNVFEPTQRFGGLKVYDSGSSNATASLAWDSQKNHWVYQNASGSTYSGGMLISGPRNTGSLGEEVGLTSGKVPVSQGSDHIQDSDITNSTGSFVGIGVNTQITGSLIVTAGVTASLQGTSSWSTNSSTASYFITSSVTSASLAATASYFITSSVTNAATASYVDTALTASYFITSSVTNAATASYVQSSSYALTASYVLGGTPGPGGSDFPYTGSAIISGSLQVTGSLYVSSQGAVELRVVDNGVNIGNSITDIHTVTGSLNVSGSITGSLQGSASYALTASYALSAPGGSSAGYFGANFDGQGTPVLINATSYFRMPRAGTITAWSVVGDGTYPSCSLDVWKVADGAAIPTSANSIISGKANRPFISGSRNALRYTSLPTWTTTFAANDLFAVTIVSSSTATKINFTMECTWS